MSNKFGISQIEDVYDDYPEFDIPADLQPALTSYQPPVPPPAPFPTPLPTQATPLFSTAPVSTTALERTVAPAAAPESTEDIPKLFNDIKARLGDLSRIEKNIQAIQKEINSLPEFLNKLSASASNQGLEQSLQSLLEVLEVISHVPESLPLKDFKNSLELLTKKISSLNSHLPTEIAEIKTSLNNLISSLAMLQQSQSTLANSQIEIKNAVAGRSIGKRSNSGYRTLADLATFAMLILTVVFIFYDYYSVSKSVTALETSVNNLVKTTKPAEATVQPVVQIKDERKISKVKR